MDDDGNISDESSEMTVIYAPGKPPEVFSVLATNKNIPESNPPKYTDLVVDGKASSEVFIKWISTDFDAEGETLDNLKINIYYSTNNIDFFPINSAQNISPNISSSRCTVNGKDSVPEVIAITDAEGNFIYDRTFWTGCFNWILPSNLYGELLFIRVEAIDGDGLGASGMAPPLNAGNLSIIAGDIDKRREVRRDLRCLVSLQPATFNVEVQAYQIVLLLTQKALLILLMQILVFTK